MPGSDYLASITNFWRVYAGATEKSAQKCEDFLQTLIDVEAFPLTRLSSMTASESAKVLENTYRAVNIAFIDEWTKYAEVADIDLFEVINAIKIRPTHSNMMYPGLGVGGYCLTKDPAFTPAAVREFLEDDDLDFPFSRLALKTNQAMPKHAASHLRQLLGGCISGKRVLVLGVSYREDIGDTRYSAVEAFVKNLEQEGAVVTPYDPYVLFWPEMNLELPKQIPDPKEFDAIVISVRHENFIKFDFVNWLSDARPVILDAVDLLDAKVRAEIRARGIRMTSLGRGVSH
jgi:nucleotide sugar dehydrogenase